MSHRHHGHHGSNQPSSDGYGAPAYNYDPLQQAPGASYGQQVAPYGGYDSNAYGQQPYYGGGYAQQQVTPYQPSGYGGYPGQELQSLQAEEHRHRQNEHRAEMGALGAVAFAAVSSLDLHLDLVVNFLELQTNFT